MIYRVLYLEVGSAVSSKIPLIQKIPVSNTHPSWPPCCLLAPHEPRPILPELEEVYFDDYECSDFHHFLRHCKFYPIIFAPQPTIFFTLHEADTPQCGLGLYVSGVAIHGDSGSNSWSCANSA